MHIPVNGGKDEGPLGDPFNLIKIILKVGDSFFHHLSGLQHKGQDQLARTELVADFFHRRQQDGIQRVDG